MHDNSTHLVKMANEISHFFRLKPEEQAVAGTANHIKRYWDPRMRAKMAEHLAHGGEGLNPLALKAVQLVCTPAPAGAPASAKNHS
jgi:formate dehydrogenase subunit delta